MKNLVTAAAVTVGILAASTAAASAGAASLAVSPANSGQIQATEIGFKRHKGGHRRHFRNDYYFTGYGYGHPYYDDCHFVPRRFWGGHRYYWKRVRICY